MSSSVIEVATQAYQDQNPGTSGLRKKVSVFKQPNYLENFVQSIIDACLPRKPKHLVVGGDGRFYNDEAIKKIINICAANGVEKMVVGKDGILSTPAASALIRRLKTDGGIILTASHNPGGEDGDFGIKYNLENGGPAPDQFTNKVHEISKNITAYKSLFKRPNIDLSEIKTFHVAGMTVEVVDSVDIYLEVLKDFFDFDKIKTLFQTKEGTKKQFKMLCDCMNGVAGPYAKRILVDELGAPESCLINAKPLPNFGGKHPDPNLTYAKDLVDALKSNPDIDFGCAFDGDADRNMILGPEAFFVTPSDSLALIAFYVNHIKHFALNGFKGFARSFPTAPAVDKIAEFYKANSYETPTGWKYFCNLMDKQLISICGEESFGTGSTHIREKDGLWAVLAWLSILADKDGQNIKELVIDHWRDFGRDYYSRYDFEDCDESKAQAMMKELDGLLLSKTLVGKTFGEKAQYKIVDTGNFEYVDPTNNSVTRRQGLFVRFHGGARIIVRLSGTGSSGATIRFYISDYLKLNVLKDNQAQLKDLLELGYAISKFKEYIGRDTPDVIT